MSYEMKVLVIGQEQPISLPFSSSILLENEFIYDHYFGRYFKICPFFMQTKGILYSLGRCDSNDRSNDSYLSFSALSICDSDFDHPLSKTPYTHWIPEEVLYDLTPLYVFEKDIAEVEKILSFLLSSSPEKMIMFRTRYQCSDEEIICGVIQKDVFFGMLENHELYFNICYIVKG